jgi:hypothetical protein
MSPITAKSERRKKSRNRPPSLVYVELPSGNGGMMRDLSEEGFAVRVMIPLRAGGNTYFAFSLSETIRIEGEGEILWIGEDGRVAGVRFTRVTSTALEQIRKWLSKPHEFSDREGIAGKRVAPPVSTLEQLREEIRSIPMGGEPPKAIPDAPPPPPPEAVPAAAEATASTPSLEDAPVPESAPPPQTALPAQTAPPPESTPLAESAPPPQTALPAQTAPPPESTPLAESTPPPQTALPAQTAPPPASTPLAESAPPPQTTLTPQTAPPPESTPLPGMALPGLHATLLGGKKTAHEPEIISEQAATPVLPSLPPLEKVPEASEDVAPKTPAEKILSRLRSTMLSDRPVASAPETPSTSPPLAVPRPLSPMDNEAPVPPPIADEIKRGFPPPRPTPIETDTASEPRPFIPLSARNDRVSAEPQNPFQPLGFAETNVEPPQHDPSLPDISQILIQPSGRRTHYSQNPSAFEPLPSPEPWSKRRLAGWTDQFTLTRAVVIMIVLTLFAAVATFHREVGQSLIWLGELMGGIQIHESRQPAATDAVSSGAPIRPPSNPSGSPSQEGAVAEPKAQDQRTAADGAGLGNNAETALSDGAKNTVPPVTPLSDLAGPSSSTPGHEAGQAEYLQAMQILRGESTGASQREVVRLLWSAVEKGNPSAELALAEMYWHGQGVARNCDQTRILLSAAARRGSAAAEKRLRQFQREGCE